MLGVVEDAPSQPGSIELKRGDVVVCYTDGVTEAMNPRLEMFAQRGLLESVAYMENADAAEVVRTLHAKIRKFAEGAPQSDDIVVLALKYRGTNVRADPGFQKR